MNHVCQPMSAVSVHRPLRKAIGMDLDGTVAIGVRQVPLGKNNAISSDFQKDTTEKRFQSYRLSVLRCPKS